MITKGLLEKINAYLAEGWGGRLISSYFTAEIDGIITRLMPPDNRLPEFAVFATGSYGRQELCPYSDIDIMIFSSSKQSPGVNDFLYRLWDTGLQVSHAVRTPSDCIGDAMRDIQIRTSMLEARFICGDRSLAALYREEVLQKLRARRKKDFIAMKLREIQERHARYGNTPFLLQPNVKESCGGLRDIQSALWLTMVLFRYDRFDRFRELIGEDDYFKFLRAYDFLLRLRFVIHLLSRRKNDRLLFEIQEQAAEMMKIRKTKKFSAVERMMRYYFVRAGTVNTVSSSIFRICGEKIARKPLIMRVRKINENFLVSKGQLIVRDDGLFRRDPSRIMEAFSIHARTGTAFSHHLLETIRRNAIHINAASRNSREMTRYFFEVLHSGRIYRTLRLMHDTGVLGKFIPEFGVLRYLLVNSFYHEYPVDEHSLACVRALESIAAGRDEHTAYLKRIYDGIQRKDMLFLALLLHDVGKARGRGHEREGYRRIKVVTERLRLDAGAREMVESLVRYHILMSDTAFKHDIESPEVIAAFAEKISSEELLHSIYLMTYADMSSVSTTYWTPWRASLLHGLYRSTLEHLRGVSLNHRSGLMESIGGDDAAELEEFISLMSDDYLISSTMNRIREEMELHRKARTCGFAMKVRTLEDGTSEISICTKDRQGIFSEIIGVFAVRKLNIIDARLFSTTDGFALDRIRISNWSELWWEGMEKMIESELVDVLVGGRKIVFYGRQTVGRSIESFIEVDNERFDRYTVIEVMAPDRPGFLYEITSILSENGVNIASGKIYTEQEIANDVFYVNRDGKRLDAVTLYGVVGMLWESIES